MIQGYENLLADARLTPVIGDNDNACTLQVWILRIKSEKEIDNRFLYGRVTPGTFKSDKWTASSLDVFRPVNDNLSVEVLPLSLNTSASKINKFIQEITKGATLLDASLTADVEMNQRIAKRVAAVFLGQSFIVRPVMHLPTRDFYQHITKRLSPTSLASVDSAAISPLNKTELFLTSEYIDSSVAKAACESLSSDTGMKFSTLDSWRLGDLELLVAPSLTPDEVEKYKFSTNGDNTEFILHESITTSPCELQVIIKAFSGECLLSTHKTKIEKDCNYPFSVSLQIDEFKRNIATAFTLEVYAEPEGTSETFLCIQTGAHYIRSVNLTMNIVENVRFESSIDWLSKGAPPSEHARIAHARGVNRTNTPSRSKIGEQPIDEWLDLNLDIEKKISDYIPMQSDGRFFPKLSDSRGLSRLDLTDWLRKIFERYSSAQIAWIDPFMEDAGIDLLNRLGTGEGDYIIITSSLPKTERPSFARRKKHFTRPATKTNEVLLTSKARIKILQESRKPTRLQKMIAQCRLWLDSYGSVRLRILALPAEKLHDRMILIRSRTGVPIAGYHLSNSIQRANENHPLLITPIPSDVLPSAFDYLNQIIQGSLYQGAELIKAQILFDSVEARINRTSNETPQALSPLDLERAGDVLSWWLEEPELAKLDRYSLLELLNFKKITEDGELNKDYFSVLPLKLWTDGLPLSSFNTAWDSVGYFLAYSHAGEIYENQQPPISDSFVAQLLSYLDSDRKEALPAPHRDRVIDIDHYISQDLYELLISRQYPERIFQHSRTEVAWGDYYAIKILWLRKPSALISWLDSEVNDSEKQNPRKRALITCTLRWAQFTLQFEKNREQLLSLLNSKTPIANWIGLSALEGNLQTESDLEIFEKIHNLDQSLQALSLCWLINEGNYRNSGFSTLLVNKLTTLLPARLESHALTKLLNVTRGNLGRLFHLSTWILQILLIPLLEKNKITPEQIAEEWLADITKNWDQALDGNHLSFSLSTDGAFTDELVILYEHLSTTAQNNITATLKKKFDICARILRKPFGAQINWSKYSTAHQINLWLYSLSARLLQFTTDDREILNSLCEDSNEILDRRSSSDWQMFGDEELLRYAMTDPTKLCAMPLREHLRLALGKSVV